MKTIGSLLVATFAGYELARGSTLNAAVLFLLAFSLTDLPARIRTTLRAINDYIWRGIVTWPPRGKRWLKVALLAFFGFVFFAIVGIVDDTLDIERVFAGSRERQIIGTGILTLIVFWISALATGFIFVLVGIAATIAADKPSHGGTR